MRTKQEIQKRIDEYRSLQHDCNRLNKFEKAREYWNKVELLDWVLGE
jgi:hypothetical protein